MTEESHFKRRKAEIKAEKKRTQPSKKTLASNSPGGRSKPGRGEMLSFIRNICCFLYHKPG